MSGEGGGLSPGVVVLQRRQALTSLGDQSSGNVQLQSASLSRALGASACMSGSMPGTESTQMCNGDGVDCMMARKVVELPGVMIALSIESTRMTQTHC